MCIRDRDQILPILGVIPVVLLLAGVAIVEYIHYTRQFHCLGIVELFNEAVGNLAEQHSHVEHSLQLHIAGINSTAGGLAQGIVNGIRFTYVYHINLLAIPGVLYTISKNKHTNHSFAMLTIYLQVVYVKAELIFFLTLCGGFGQDDKLHRIILQNLTIIAIFWKIQRQN